MSSKDDIRTPGASNNGANDVAANATGASSEVGDEKKKREKKPADDLDTLTDKLVIEIVSCWDLPAEDLMSSDPYVKVKLDGHRLYVHETKHIPSTLEPIFTVKTGNLFLVAQDEVKRAGKVLFKVKEYDRISIKNETLGSAEVDADTLLKAKGERMEYALTRQHRGSIKAKGYIAIRCRQATRYDVAFVTNMLKGEDSEEIQAFNSADSRLMKTSGGTGKLPNVGKIIKSNHKMDRHTKVTKYRMRPHPDPEREDETKWMSKDEIDSKVMKESRTWLDIGSGTLGRVYLEVIGIDDMANMDEVVPVSGVPVLGKSNKTDSFVAVIYEDCIAKTDVIADCLNPRWMPWMQRAFILRTMYPNSQLFLGVFDYDGGVGNEHDMVGRVSVDLTNFRPGSEYLLYYNIYKSAKVGKRKSRGTIIIRLRIETDDERQNILMNLRPPPKIYINSRTISDFRIARKTIMGKTDLEVYNTRTLNAYIDELRSYKYMMHYMEDAVVNVIFWRGTYPVRIIKKFSFHLPLHSATAFLAGIMLAERPTLMPSFFMFGISWLLFAIQGYRQKSPNPWDQCKSYNEMAQMLIQGTCVLAPPSIEPHQNEKESLAYEEKWNSRIAEAEEAAAKRTEEFQKQQAEYEQYVQSVGDTTADTDISSKDHGRIPGQAAVSVVTNLNPMKLILYPIQIYLGIACDWLRFVRNIFLWEECYISFIVATGSLVLGFVFLLVPWIFIFRWSFRLIVWISLGPWMRLVDIYWYSKIEGLSEEEKKEKMKSILQAKKEQAELSAREARVQREDAEKLSAIKTLLYGKYILRVPVRNTDRYRDIPRHESSAVPENKVVRARSGAIPTVERVGGQHIDTSDGMVPKLTSPLAIAKQATKMKDQRKSAASKKLVSKVIFFLLVLPLLIMAGWYAVPYVSSRLPEIPLAHSVEAAVWKAKESFFSTKAEAETVIEEKAINKSKRDKGIAKIIEKTNDAADESEGYQEKAKNTISAWFKQISSLFGY